MFSRVPIFSGFGLLSLTLIFKFLSRYLGIIRFEFNSVILKTYGSLPKLMKLYLVTISSSLSYVAKTPFLWGVIMWLLQLSYGVSIY